MGLGRARRGSGLVLLLPGEVMFEEVLDFVKQHPGIAGAAALAVLIISFQLGYDAALRGAILEAYAMRARNEAKHG